MGKCVDFNTARKSGKNVKFDAKDSNTPYRSVYYLIWKTLEYGDKCTFNRMMEEDL